MRQILRSAAPSRIMHSDPGTRSVWSFLFGRRISAMIGLLSVASVALSAPWFALSVAGGRPGCVEVKWVQPDGPAGYAGLHDGDCVAQVDGKTVSTSDDLVKALGETRPSRATTLSLSNGRTVQVVPTKRTREA